MLAVTRTDVRDLAAGAHRHGVVMVWAGSPIALARVPATATAADSS